MMLHVHRFSYRLAALLAAAMFTTLAGLAPAASAQGTLAPTTVTLTTVGDARTQAGSPNVNFGTGALHLSTLNGHFAFTQFNLTSVPANAVISSAVLRLNVSSVLTGPNTVEVGRANGAWNEATLTWNTQPAITWGGPVTNVNANGTFHWNVTPLVTQWHSGGVSNHGFTLRGQGGAQVAFDSKEAGSIPPTLVITYTTPDRSRDLGDAPDSTNHFGVPMAAYAGVQANFPTVFDPATGAPPGPAHLDPLPFHLGPQVSREAEADVGSDEDPTNNLRPPANQPNRDLLDDGVNPNAWNVAHCQRITIPVKVFISPQAVAKFQQAGKPAYLNLWLDENHDGDWADGFTCQNSHGQPHGSVEHIVIDAPVNVVGLGAGLHTIQRLSGYIAWPAALAGKPRWVRATLSERPSNKTLQFGPIKYGDGRGYPAPFNTGETEDYLRTP